MPTHVKKSSLLAIILAVSLQAVSAQNTPAPAPTTPAPASPTAPVDSSTATTFDYLFNHKGTEGSAAKAGADVASSLSDKIKAVDVLKTPGLDDPEVRARFQTYLSLKEIPDDRITEYFAKVSQVSETLKAGDTFRAWKILYAMSEYQDLDAGISRELANRVEGIWNSDRTKNGLAQDNTKLRSDIDTHNHNADMIAQDLRYQDEQEKQKNGKGGSTSNSQANNSNTTNSLLNPNVDPVAAEAALMPTMSGSLQGKMELTDEYLKMLEARAKIKLNEIKADRMSDQDKSDFADYIKMLYDNHRYYHVIIAADFYRALFNESEYPSSILTQLSNAVKGVGGPGAQGANNNNSPGNQVNQVTRAFGIHNQIPAGTVNQLASSMGMSNPTNQSDSNNEPVSLADQVTSALEINNRVNQAIEVFKYKAGKGQIAAAAEQLQQAFLANEYHPALQGLPRDQKEQVGEFLAKLDVLKNQLEVRGFEQVEAQLAEIKKIASDFDVTKPLALVNGIKLESQLRLGKAKLLAQSGDLTDAMKEFQVAAEEWPGNPALQTSANGFFNTEDAQNQSTTEFDQLVHDQNYRKIFENQLAFAAAVKGDTTREQQLKDALEKVQKAEMASEKANLLVMNGDIAGAWETIELATKDLPDDMKLNKLLASLSGRSADFVSALDKAREAEVKKELGYSLTWYVNAQSFYPASTIANDGIERISKQLLNPQTASGSTN
jgi:hypothetical protein